MGKHNDSVEIEFHGYKFINIKEQVEVTRTLVHGLSTMYWIITGDMVTYYCLSKDPTAIDAWKKEALVLDPNGEFDFDTSREVILASFTTQAEIQQPLKVEDDNE